MKKNVIIRGMHCQHCSAHDEDAFKKVGVSAKVNLESKSALLTGQNELSDAQITGIIDGIGFETVGISDVRDSEE